jgi:hypothetical protein
MPRSFNGRTKVFEASYVGSIPALGARTMRSKLIRMSSRFLIGRQLVRFPYVPFVQWIRIERYERSDSGSSPERDTRF